MSGQTGRRAMMLLKADHEARSFLERKFPDLAGTNYTITSPATRLYNCIAWAVGDMNRWWWPTSPRSYWPPSAPRELSVCAFVEAFHACGFEITNNYILEDGLEKLAIYTKQKEPTHAARQLLDGSWTSKLGEFVDITHVSPYHISGSRYGSPCCVMARPRRD